MNPEFLKLVFGGRMRAGISQRSISSSSQSGIEPGIRVVRGPDWKWRNQDGGPGNLGTLTKVVVRGISHVIWDNGDENAYRTGAENRYDLRVYDNAQIGVRHDHVNCDVCDEAGVKGFRWKCCSCYDYDLCSKCYMADKHQTSHEFMRYDIRNDSCGVRVPPRDASKKIQALGAFAQAKVTRGEDWRYGDQDGGNRKVGTVLEVRNWGDGSVRSAVRVRWGTGRTDNYRMGHRGNVDLKCIKPTSGDTFYPEHLPPLGQDIPKTKVGARVKTDFDEDVFSMMHGGHSGWGHRTPEKHSLMQAVAKALADSDSDSDDKTDSDSDSSEDQVPATQAGSGLKAGDMVKISQNAAYVKSQQDGHGGWNNKMRQNLGRIGQVVLIYADGDVKVKVDGTTWCLNPSCCTFISKGDAPIVYDDSREEQNGTISELLKSFRDDVKKRKSIVKATIPGKLKEVQAILKEDSSGVNATEDGKTALQIACHKGYGEIVKELLRHNAKLDIADSDGDYPIHFCAFGNRPEMIDILVNHSADVNLLNAHGLTVLHLAVHNQQTGCVKTLISHGADPNTQDEAGNTPLHDAITKDHSGIISLLIKVSNIDFTIRNQGGFNLLQHAASKGNTSAVDGILERNPRVVNISKADGFTALHLAAVNDHGDIVKSIVRQDDVDFEGKNKQGHTALISSLIREYTGVIETLVSHGANVRGRDKAEDTCLHFALLKGPEKRTVSDTSEIGKIMKSLKVEKAEYGVRLGVACYLIDHGAEINVINKKGKTPLDNVEDQTAREIIHNYTKLGPVVVDAAAAPGKQDATSLENKLLKAKVECRICSENMADVRFEPCGHRIICRECCARAKKCIECQQPIKEKVFMEIKNVTGGPAESKVSDVLFARGDLVMVELDADVMKVIQEGIGNWDPRMAQCIKKTGTVEKVLDTSGIEVNFDGLISWTFHRDVLVKIEEFSRGDTVRLSTDRQRVMEWQRGHGDWRAEMEKALGKVATVLNVLPSRDLIISVENQMWALNPSCCSLVSKGGEEDVPDNPVKPSRKLKCKDVRGSNVGDNLMHSKRKGDQSVDEADLVQKAEEGKLQNVIRIVERNPHQIDKKSSGKTALQVSSHQGHTEVVIYLLERGADVDVKDDDKDTALLHAVYGNRPEILQILLHKGSCTNGTNKNGATALHVAINKHSRRCAHVLLSHPGCDVNIQDSSGAVPLYSALKEDISLADSILAHDDVDFTLATKRGCTILHQAAIAGHVMSAKRAIEKAPEIVNAKKYDGFTALHLSAYNNHVDVSETLLKQGMASVNVRNDNYATPLMLAAAECCTAVIELLIDNGADVKALDEDGNSCLHLVLQNAKEPEEPPTGSFVAKMKLSLDSRVKQYQVRAAVACYLVEHGADIHQENDKKLTPMDVLRYPALADVIKEQYSKRAQCADMGQSSQCMACHDTPSDVTLKPCGHRVVCRNCCQRLNKCLKCETTIDNKVIDGTSPLLQSRPGVATSAGGEADEMQEMRNKMAQLEDTFTCSICMDLPKNVVFLCGHATCHKCSQALSLCHICRQPITQRINMFA